MSKLRRIDAEDVRKLCPENYSKGSQYFRGGAVTNAWRTPSALYASVAGSAVKPYEASVGPRDDGSYWARCTCPAARRQSICKHAAAVLVAWAEKPDAFVERAEPELPADGKARGTLKPDSEAKRLRRPRVDRLKLVAAGLDKAEALLVDVCSRGILSITAEQVSMIRSLAETLEAHKLRRLARQVVEIARAAEVAQRGADGFDDLQWARLLADTWFILVATRKALDRVDEGDRAALEDLIGKTWLEKDLRRVEDLILVELAYQTLVLPSGFRVEASYLLDIADGSIYAEKLITPLQLKKAASKPSYSRPLRVSAAGVYPGFPPLRLKLIEAVEMDSSDQVWDRVVDRAETSATALRQQLTQATASLVAPQEVYCLFRPASVIITGGRLYLADVEDRLLPIGEESLTAAYGLRGALTRGPLGAVFCRVRFADQAMEAEPLSAILLRSDAGERLVRLTA